MIFSGNYWLLLSLAIYLCCRPEGFLLISNKAVRKERNTFVTSRVFSFSAVPLPLLTLWAICFPFDLTRFEHFRFLLQAFPADSCWLAFSSKFVEYFSRLDGNCGPSPPGGTWGGKGRAHLLLSLIWSTLCFTSAAWLKVALWSEVWRRCKWIFVFWRICLLLLRRKQWNGCGRNNTCRPNWPKLWNICMANFFCQRIGSGWLVTIGLFAHFLVQLWPVMGKLKVLTLFRFGRGF